MASRSIHLAVTNQIAEKIEVKDINRLKLGAILPDAYAENWTTHDSHLKIMFSDGEMITYDLSKYLGLFRDKLQSDDLYLGYYLHLIQDMVYRDFVYHKYHWNPTILGNVERLHKDYSIINSYVIKQYHLQNDIVVPDDIEQESIFDLYPFGIYHLMEELQADFVEEVTGDIFFFTEEMADLFIRQATDLCLKEIESLYHGGRYIDEFRWAWKH